MGKSSRTIFGTGIILLVLFIYLALAGGSRNPANDFMNVVFFGVVCTAGLSLIPLFLLGYFVGTLATRLLSRWFPSLSSSVAGASTSKKGAVKKQIQETPSAAPQDLLALKKYATEARDSGIADWEIKRRLKKQGWSEEQIEAALKS